MLGHVSRSAETTLKLQGQLQLTCLVACYKCTQKNGLVKFLRTFFSFFFLGPAPPALRAGPLRFAARLRSAPSGLGLWPTAAHR